MLSSLAKSKTKKKVGGSCIHLFTLIFPKLVAFGAYRPCAKHKGDIPSALIEKLKL